MIFFKQVKWSNGEVLRLQQKGRGRGAIWIILPWHPSWRVGGENCLVCMALTSVGARGLLAWMVRGVVHTHTMNTRGTST